MQYNTKDFNVRQNPVEINTNNLFFKSELRYVMRTKILIYCQNLKRYFKARRCLQVFKGFLIKTALMLFLSPSILCRWSIVVTFRSVRLISMKHKFLRATESTVFSWHKTRPESVERNSGRERMKKARVMFSIISLCSLYIFLRYTFLFSRVFSLFIFR